MTDSTQARPTVAVIGGGVSGLTAAYLLSRTHHVTLFEADDRVGGHAHTHDVPLSDGTSAAVDSGFIVLNDRTYPLLQRLFAELGVDTRPTEMSMSITCDECGLNYVGGRKAPGIFAQRRRLLDPRFWRLLLGVRRFQKAALRLLADEPESGLTYLEYEPAYRYGYDVGQRFPEQDWGTLEAALHEGWERWHPGTWERFKDAIQYGWETVRGPSKPVDHREEGGGPSGVKASVLQDPRKGGAGAE